MNKPQSADVARQAEAYHADPATAKKIVAVLTACAVEERTRDDVERYLHPLLVDRFHFTVDAERHPDAGKRITDRDQLYLSDDEALYSDYLKAAHELHRAHGYDVKEGHCPHLIAQDERRQAEQELMQHAEQFFPWAKRSQIHGANRKRWVELLLTRPVLAR